MTDPKSHISHILRVHVFPALELNPHDFELVELDRGVATIRLSDVCSSCPANIPSLISAMESELKKHTSDVEIVELLS